MFKSIRYLLIVSTLLTVSTTSALATGTWTGGQDTYHVPMAWCIVNGTPAQANPNIAGDTTTDALIWRRHERPTDNIFVNPTGITLRSAILSVWDSVNYPQIDDPVITPGTQEGDMRGEDVTNFGDEYNQMLNACDTAYASPMYGLDGIGITAVNAGLFHDGNGDYVTTIGWGGCNEGADGNCREPYIGRIVVIDNQYKHPSSTDLTWPGTTTRFALTDPWDQLVAHEVGHALSLEHRDDSTLNLMHPQQQDNNGDGQADNRALNNAEIMALRLNAQLVGGVETDPPGRFDPARFAVMRQPDQIKERDIELPHQDLASVRTSLDKDKGIFVFDHQLFGLLPEKAGSQRFWSLVDIDGPDFGIEPEQLQELGLPESKHRGADFVALVEIQNRKASGSAWHFRDGELFEIEEFAPELQTMVMHPHVAEATGPTGKFTEDREGGYPLHHIVNFRLSNEFVGVELGKPFRVQTLNVINGEEIVDSLDDEDEGRGVEFLLNDVVFPHCYAQNEGIPGQTLPIELEGLRPSAPIHGLLGPDEVFQGQTDQNGGGLIDFPIPEDATPGFHLVTVGIDETALTADCVIHINEDGGQAPDLDQRPMLPGQEELLLAQQRLLEQLGSLIKELSTSPDIPKDRIMDLTDRFEELLRKQSDLLDRFSVTLERTMEP